MKGTRCNKTGVIMQYKAKYVLLCNTIYLYSFCDLNVILTDDGPVTFFLTHRRHSYAHLAVLCLFVLFDRGT